MRLPVFSVVAAAVAVAVYALAVFIQNDYAFFAGYVILQFIVLATAWNILGGYCGYVNFGTAGFFAIGAYSTVALYKLTSEPSHTLIVTGGVLVAGLVTGLLGLGVGYLTLRLRGVFFAIATLAMAVVLQTLIINWTFVGGSRGAYIIRPDSLEVLGFNVSYIQYLFLLMLALAVVAVATARGIERSRLGYGFATIRDDELAAEACGVPTLKLKLIATTISGAFMGMTGATFPYYIGYLEPASAFGLQYAVNAIAMPMIGGTTSWIGPVIGAILLGTVQQYATVTISSSVNLLIVGVLLVAFVIIAPNGIIGLVQQFLRHTAPSEASLHATGLILVALYSFIASILGIIWSLPIMTAAGGWVAAGGLVLLIFSILYAALAYGLLTLQPWAPHLGIPLFVFSVFGIGLMLAVGRAGENATLPIVAILMSVGAIVLLLQHQARDLYRPTKRARA